MNSSILFYSFVNGSVKNDPVLSLMAKSNQIHNAEKHVILGIFTSYSEHLAWLSVFEAPEQEVFLSDELYDNGNFGTI